MEQKNSLSMRLGWAMTLLGAVACFAFLQYFYPYHLQHREQTMLFLCNADYIALQYPLSQSGFLSRLAGDFLQQFFYYLVAGPAIVAALLTLIGVLAYQIVRSFSAKPWNLYLAYAVGIGCMLWEGSRECLPEYPLAATIQVVGWLLLIRLAITPKSTMIKGGLLLVSCIMSYLLFGAGGLPNTKLYGKPDMILEHQMALDVEASYGHWDKVELLTQDNRPYNLDIYYRNLSRAKRGLLLDGMLEHYQNFADGLFMPVNENGNFFLFSAAGEAWWAIGDLTMAEHATLLGMIFSPRHTGTRCLRRLAEINMAKGDDKAAMKYLRMLEQTIPHKKWAQYAISQLNNNDESARPLVSWQQQVQPTQDTLRLSTQYRASLENLLHCNPMNQMAQQYLIAFDLMTKDMLNLANDIERFPSLAQNRLVQEALLIVMTSRPEKRETMMNHIQEKTWNDFQEYNHLYETSQGNPTILKTKFGQTYWYYMHFTNKDQ